MPPAPPPPYGPPGQPYLPPGQPWYQPGQPWQSPTPRTNGWAIVSLIFGVLGGILISVVCGIVALNRSREYGGRGMAIAGLVLSGMWTAGAIMLVALGAILGAGTTSVDRLAVGDCLAGLPTEDTVLTVDTARCDEVHAAEVFAVLTLPDGKFPGRLADDEALDRCGPALADYAPAAVDDASLRLNTIQPSRESWDTGDRELICIATVDPPRTGSIKG